MNIIIMGLNGNPNLGTRGYRGKEITIFKCEGLYRPGQDVHRSDL